MLSGKSRFVLRVGGWPHLCWFTRINMIAISFAFAVASIHFYIFYLESLRWGHARTNKLFGITETEAKASQLMAFNQGFYNLILALGVIAGVALKVAGGEDYGNAIADFACLAVLSAGLVLFFSRPSLIRPAMIQVLPAIGYLGFRFLGY